MARFISGIVLFAIAVVGLALAIGDHTLKLPRDIIVWLGIFGLPGAVLFYFGLSYIRRRNTVINKALVMLKKDGAVDAVDLAASIGMDGHFVAEVLVGAQRKGLLPGKSSGPGAIGQPSKSEPTAPPQRVVVCTKCHMESPVGTKFCSNCGHAFFE